MIFYIAKDSQRLFNSVMLHNLLLSLTSSDFDLSKEMLSLFYCYDHTLLLKDKYLLLYSW